MLPVIGSKIIQDTSSELSLIAFRTASALLKGTVRVSLAKSSGTPALSDKPKVVIPEPALASK